MPTVYQTIVDEFLAELAKAPEFDERKIDQLKQIIAAKKKPKPEELVALFSQPAGGQIK